MRKLVVLMIVAMLIMSLAAPAGAVFAIEEVIPTNEAVSETAKVVADISSQVISLPLQDTNRSEVTSIEAAQTDEEPPAFLPSPVVIAQLQVGASGSAKDEYIALYNNGDEDIDVTDWCIRNKNLADFACFVGESTDYIVRPHAYIALSSQERADTQAVQVMFPSCTATSGCIVASGDTIRLVDQGKQLVDTIEWLSQPSGFYAIERQWDMTKIAVLGVWAWQKQIAHYGHIKELTECSDGTIVLDESFCTVPELLPCDSIIINEIAANTDTQFIELYNPTDALLSLTGCKLQTNRSKTAAYMFEDDTLLRSKEYLVVYIEDTSLTLTRTTKGLVSLVSLGGALEADSVSYANLANTTSWALFDDGWKQTYTPTPGADNHYTQYAACDDGYYRNLTTGRCNRVVEPTVLIDCGEGRERNPATGRCRNLPAARELMPCREGQYRSEETNRCRSIALAANILKSCADDQFRNPATNRCKKIASSDDVALADCGEGRERNPMTNRCRNVTASAPPAAGFAVEQIKDAANVFVGWWALGGITVLALGYAGWEWREEVSRFIRKVAQFGRSK